MATRTHVMLTVTISHQRSTTTYRLVSPTGRALVVTSDELRGTMYDPESLGGRGGRLVLPLATVEALSRLGSVEEPTTTPREETP